MKRLLAAVLLVGCSPGAGYVQADRLTYDAIAPEYLEYVGEDAALSSSAKARRVDTVRSWNARILRAQDADEPAPVDSAISPAGGRAGE